MTMQPVLPTCREHDLPPKWDGRVVVWEGWESLDTDGPIFICPPPRELERCQACGSQSRPLVSRGRVARSGVVHLDQIRRRDAERERLPFGSKHNRPAAALYELTAFRCPDCKFDHVLDADGRMWDLDESDYRAEGSYER